MAEPIPTIEPTPDGPLKVSGAIGLTNSKGEAVATRQTFFLCRCGGSANKPFCDGTHGKIGFSGARLSDPAKRETRSYTGAGITILDNRSICAHAGHCTDHSPDVFRMKAKPWIAPDGDDAAHIAETIRMCPSGALAVQVDGVRQEPTGRAPAIRIGKDGPYEVVGGPPLAGEAQPVSPEHYTLCRCGQSKNKPFCDGTHWTVDFKDDAN